MAEALAYFNTREALHRDDLCDMEHWRWADDAACVGTDPEAWFDPQDEDTSMQEAICTSCPVRRECLSHALEYDEWGFWGGLGQGERRRMLGRGPRRSGKPS